MLLYKTIDDCPIYNFNKITMGGNLGSLIANKLLLNLYNLLNSDKFNSFKLILKVLMFINNKLDKIWVKLNDEHESHFNSNESYQLYLKKKIQYLDLYSKAYEEGDKINITLAEVELQGALDMLNKGATGSGVYETAGHIGKVLGIRIDVRKVPVREFFTLLEVAKNIIKKS